MARSDARWILHADMDAFYASIEQRDNPELRGKPVIVGATSARGVVAAASYEARRFGVHSAMPGFRAKALCPDGIFLPSNMAHYAAVSAEIHTVFEGFTDLVEPLALDEAFLDITGSIGLFGGPRALAEKLKQAIYEKTELFASVGVAPCKLVAKIACAFGKPNGLCLVEPAEVVGFLAPLPVRRLWGVGPVLEARLVELGIRTLAELASTDPARLRAAAGNRAEALVLLARGVDPRPVEADRAPKSYGEENTFASDVTDPVRIKSALTAHAEAVAQRLRHDGYVGRTVTLKVKLGRARGRRATRDGASEPVYPLLSRSKTLADPSASGSVLRDVAVTLWDEAHIAEPVRLLGVSMTNLTKSDARQLDLFGAKRDDKLGPTLDAITQRFGKGAISRAVEAPEKLTPSGRRKRGSDE